MFFPDWGARLGRRAEAHWEGGTDDRRELLLKEPLEGAPRTEGFDAFFQSRDRRKSGRFREGIVGAALDRGREDRFDLFDRFGCLHRFGCDDRLGCCDERLGHGRRPRRSVSITSRIFSRRSSGWNGLLSIP